MVRRTSLFVLTSLVLIPGSLGAQTVADQIRDAMKSDVFRMEMLFRSDAEVRLEDFGPRSEVDVAVARLRVGGDLEGGFRYYGQFEFAGGPTLLDVRLGWSPGPEFLVRAGRFKTPFSRDFVTFFGARDFNGTARMVSRLGTNRQYGVELSGRPNEHLGWRLGGFTGASASGVNERGLAVGRLVFDRLFATAGGRGLSVGVNAGVGTDEAIAERLYGSSFRGDGTLIGLDARYERGPLLIASEWIRGDYDSERIVPDLLPDPRPPIESDASGLYVTGGWQLTDGVQALVRWERFEGPLAYDGTDDLMLFSLNFTPTAHVRMQAIYRAPHRNGRKLDRVDPITVQEIARMEVIHDGLQDSERRPGG